MLSWLSMVTPRFVTDPEKHVLWLSKLSLMMMDDDDNDYDFGTEMQWRNFKLGLKMILSVRKWAQRMNI